MDVQLTNIQQLCDAVMSKYTKISEEGFQLLVYVIKTVLKVGWSQINDGNM